MLQQSKSERRKEQNRRAQANHRKRRQQRFQYLEQQLGFLEKFASSTPEQDNLDSAAEDVQAQGHASHHNQLEPAGLMATTMPRLDQQTFDVFPRIHDTLESSCFAENSFNVADASHENRHDMSWSDSVFPSNPCPTLDISTPLYPRNSSNKTSCYAFDALASNAKSLGYPNEALIKATSSSRFFSPLSILDTSSLPEAFRPTMAQLTYDHHPYIDCIPLPDLRSRMVLALNHKPPLVSHLELFFDVLSGGLASGTDPQDGSQWSMKGDFALKWKILSCDTGTLLAQTLSSNPPVRVVLPPGG